MNLYQVNWKYRDELRPRFGLLRAREFLMKDSYSFHVDEADLRRTYRRHVRRVLAACSRAAACSRSAPVEGEAGEIGGDVNHEFMAVAEVGEDDFVWCTNCDYAANVEVARRRATDTPPEPGTPAVDAPPREKVHTPGLPGIDGVAEHLGAPPSELLKCIAFDLDGELGLALVPGDREVNPYALMQAVAPRRARLFDDEDFERHPELPKGYIGPDYRGAALVVADPMVRRAARAGSPARTRSTTTCATPCSAATSRSACWADLVSVVSGDPCPR